MASIYKRKRMKSIPEGAKIVKTKRGTVARWVTGNGQKQEGLVKGDKVVLEARKYTISYSDMNGSRICISGTTDRETSQQLAVEHERTVALVKSGMMDARTLGIREQGKRPIDEHLEDYIAHLRAKNVSKRYMGGLRRVVNTTCQTAGFETLADIDQCGVERHLNDLADRGRSIATCNEYIGGFRAFTAWLTDRKRLPVDPLKGLKTGSAQTDRRHVRRPFLVEEFAHLVQAARTGPHHRDEPMTGPERGLCYVVAVQTGLRAAECRSLRAADFDLDRATVRCRAACTKNAMDAHQPLKPETVLELREYLAHKSPAAQVFQLPRKTSRMIQFDLAAARQAWIGEAPTIEQRRERQDRDFLTYQDKVGACLDFHALRHTCGSWLCMAGVHPKKVQRIMRHANISLTMDTYGHLFPGDEAEAVNSLPDMPGALTRRCSTLPARDGLHGPNMAKRVGGQSGA